MDRFKRLRVSGEKSSSDDCKLDMKDFFVLCDSIMLPHALINIADSDTEQQNFCSHPIFSLALNNLMFR